MERYVTEGLLQPFQAELEREERSPATVAKYLRDVKAFLGFQGNQRVTKESVIRFKKYLQDRYKPASVNSMLAAVNRFLKAQGWYDCLVRPLKLQRQAFRDSSRELTREEYFRLLKAAQARGKTRLCLLMQTICATGIRVSELPFITREALNVGRATVCLKGKARTVLLPAALCRALKAYLKDRGNPGGSVFVTRSGRPLDRSNILHDMKALCRWAGVDPEKVYPHNLRHLFACQYYQEVKDLSRLADILGHTNVNTTRIYTRASGAEQRRQMECLGLVLGEGKKNTS